MLPLINHLFCMFGDLSTFLLAPIHLNRQTRSRSWKGHPLSHPYYYNVFLHSCVEFCFQPEFLSFPQGQGHEKVILEITLFTSTMHSWTVVLNSVLKLTFYPAQYIRVGKLGQGHEKVILETALFMFIMYLWTVTLNSVFKYRLLLCGNIKIGQNSNIQGQSCP